MNAYLNGVVDGREVSSISKAFEEGLKEAGR